jgi:ABC-type transport system involved in cytochrome c biogenesis permease subunit
MLSVVYIVLTLLVAVFFYWLRCRHRFAFGCVEIVIAMLVVTFTFAPPVDYLTGDTSYGLQYLLYEAASLSAGIYIFVRGMDNMAQDLPLSWRPIWHRLFGV